MNERSRAHSIIEPLAALPILTALAYSIGVAYSSGLYQRVGLDNLDLLGFSVQTYVTRSYAAFDVFVFSIDVLTVVACVFLAIAGVVWISTGNKVSLSGAAVLAAAALVVGNDRERLAIVIVVGVLAILQTSAKVHSFWRMPALVGLAVVLWLITTLGAESAGRYQACRITQGSDFDTPLVRVVTEGPPYPGSVATPWEQLDDSGRAYLYDLRLFNTAPAGLIVYADDGPPSELIFLPIESIVSVTSIPDGGNVGGEATESC